jgi:hypothetical protein
MPNTDTLNIIKTYLPLLIPIILLELGLLIFALIDLVRRERTRVLPKWMWAIIIVVLEIFGPIIYLLVGREE